MSDVATVLFVHFNFIIQFRNMYFIPEINPHCILSQIYSLFTEFYYALCLFFVCLFGFLFLKICIIIQ